MTVPTATTTEGGVSTLRRHRRLVLLVLGALVVVAIATALGLGGAPYSARMDPRNPDRDGGQALARVLDDQGVQVTVVRDQASLLRQRVDRSATVVVTSPEDLAPSTLERLQDKASDAAALVMIGDSSVLSAELDTDLASVRPGTRAARCGDELVSDLSVQVEGWALSGRGCFGDEAGAVLLRRGSTWALADETVLSNGAIRRADAAALGLRLLGQGERLVWYVPDLADADTTEGFSIDRLLPRWLFPGLGLVAAAVLALVAWRARRLGPLVTEPLPVVVRAAESTHGRGRLYRRTTDREHATAILVGATRRRLAAALALPRDVGLEQLTTVVSERTGRDAAAVRALLAPPPATTDNALVTLGRRLSELENEVRTP